MTVLSMKESSIPLPPPDAVRISYATFFFTRGSEHKKQTPLNTLSDDCELKYF